LSLNKIDPKKVSPGTTKTKEIGSRPSRKKGFALEKGCAKGSVKRKETLERGHVEGGRTRKVWGKKLCGERRRKLFQGRRNHNATRQRRENHQEEGEERKVRPCRIIATFTRKGRTVQGIFESRLRVETSRRRIKTPGLEILDRFWGQGGRSREIGEKATRILDLQRVVGGLLS